MPKQIYDPTLSDLQHCPVWTHLAEGEDGALDELSVAPATETFNFETMYVALTTFEL